MCNKCPSEQKHIETEEKDKTKMQILFEKLYSIVEEKNDFLNQPLDESISNKEYEEKYLEFKNRFLEEVSSNIPGLPKQCEKYTLENYVECAKLFRYSLTPFNKWSETLEEQSDMQKWLLKEGHKEEHWELTTAINVVGKTENDEPKFLRIDLLNKAVGGEKEYKTHFFLDNDLNLVYVKQTCVE